MCILLTAANGFIGSHLRARLRARRHSVVAAARDPAKLRWRFPDVEAISCDFNSDVRPEAWMPRLAGIGAVVGPFETASLRSGTLSSGKDERMNRQSPVGAYGAAPATSVVPVAPAVKHRDSGNCGRLRKTPEDR